MNNTKRGRLVGTEKQQAIRLGVIAEQRGEAWLR